MLVFLHDLRKSIDKLISSNCLNICSNDVIQPLKHGVLFFLSAELHGDNVNHKIFILYDN